jgi:hypothetical protein
MITRHGDASYTLISFQYYEGISFVNELLNGNLGVRLPRVSQGGKAYENP